MKKIIGAIIMMGGLLAGCATPTPGPAATPTQVLVAPTATATQPTEAPVATPTDTPTCTPTVTATTEPTNTPTAVPTYTLSGTVFFDYNGNGLRDADEPGLDGVGLQVGGTVGRTDADGRFSLSVPSGECSVALVPPDPSLRYIFPSRAAVRSVRLPLTIHVAGPTTLDFGMGQGFLTLPYGSDVSDQPFVITYTDLDLSLGSILDWTGNTSQHLVIHDHDTWNSVTPGTMDQHQGTDWAMKDGTTVRAMAPGPVIISDGGPGRGFARYVRQVVDIPGDPDVYLISYAHNSSNLVSAGPTVIQRGHAIALSGRNGRTGEDTTNPHLHVSIWQVPRSTWDRYEHLPELYDFLFARGSFEGNGRSVTYPDGTSVALDYCPFQNELFIDGHHPTFSQ